MRVMAEESVRRMASKAASPRLTGRQSDAESITTNDDDASADDASDGDAIPNADDASGGAASPNGGDDANPSDDHGRDDPSAPVRA